MRVDVNDPGARAAFERTPSQTPSVPRVSPALTREAPHPPHPPAARRGHTLRNGCTGLRIPSENTCDGQVVFPACFPGPLLLLEALASAATGLASDEHDSLSSSSGGPLEGDDFFFPLPHFGKQPRDFGLVASSVPCSASSTSPSAPPLRAREMRDIGRREPSARAARTGGAHP